MRETTLKPETRSSPEIPHLERRRARAARRVPRLDLALAGAIGVFIGTSGRGVVVATLALTAAALVVFSRLVIPSGDDLRGRVGLPSPEAPR